MRGKTTLQVGAICLAISDKVVNQTFEKQQRNQFLPDSTQLQNDLNTMNQHGGIPAIFNERKNGDEQLLIYTDTYYLGLYQTKQGDGYSIAFISPLTLYEHERLCKGTLRIQAQGWYLYSEPRLFPKGCENSWSRLYQAWHVLKQQQEQEQPEVTQAELAPAHAQYLDALDTIVDLTQQIEQQKMLLGSTITYTKVLSAGEKRDAPRDIYIFVLSEIPRISEKHMLRIKDMPDLQGRVQSINGNKLTLKFESLIDRRRIPSQGVLESSINTVIYRKQHEAINTLRKREAKNPYLLPVLVDHHYQLYEPDPISPQVDPDLQRMNREQFEAFRRALTVPDLLLVHGPPGTGKTLTITEMARYCGARHQRVLMTAGTHKAVDNVLERMPEDLIVLRVGYESNISEKMREKLIDVQAQAMQQKIKENTDRSYPLLELFTKREAIQEWSQRLNSLQQRLAVQEERWQQQKQQHDEIKQQITAPFAKQIKQLGKRQQRLERRTTHTAQSLTRWEGRHSNATARSKSSKLSFLFQLLAALCLMQVNGKRKKLQDLHQRSTETQQEQQQINIQLQQLFAQSAEYQQVTQQMQQSGNDCRATWQRGLQTIQLLQPTIQPFAVYQNPLQPPAAETLGRYHHWYTSIYEPLRSKAALLTDWRRELDKPSEQFYPELLRYADVVGATCIGAATAKGLEDLEFHLAIVDEAGQIGITDLLVPLVRAQRAVLVGDHTQLPPFVDSDVQQWLKSSAAPAEDALIENELATLDDWGELDQDQLQELLTKSAFELLFTGQIDPTHLVRFRLQGRMPKIIADFVSQHFYDNMLGTFSSEKMRHTIDQDPLFSNPLTLIDTSNVPDRLRREYKKHGDDDAAESGYTNPGEAQIIVNIAEAYQKTGREWVVIVPYRAQARLIIHELSKRIDSPDIALAERVATVDSFQGGERPKVIYGFTRSNEKGLIGFLKELRRLNVALTRAQQNIILVGNFYMLTRAQNLPFRNLMSGLYAYAQRSGDIWTYERYHRHFGPLR